MFRLTRPSRRALCIGAAAAVVVAVPAGAAGFIDFGKTRDTTLRSSADLLYGSIGSPLNATAPTVPGAAGAASVQVATGLKVTDVLNGDPTGPNDGKLFQNADMLAYWPSAAQPDWAIFCIESGPTVPGVQRIKLRGADKGKVETILTGSQACDGIRQTPWNTIIATEEVGVAGTGPGAGWALEIYDPLKTTGVQFDRIAGTFTGADAGNVRTRPALGRLAWEGLEVYADGSVIFGDELAPVNRANGGAIFKFVSDQAPAAGGPDLSKAANAAQSPYAAGKLYTLEVGGTGNNRGQGNQYGLGKWIGPIDPASARAEGQAKGTGYYRPEDLHGDPVLAKQGRRGVCWTNTGNSSINNYGEVLCLEDKPSAAAPTGAEPDVSLFLTGNRFMNQFDNLEFQPGTGIVYVIEDTPTVNGVRKPGDVWACLRDGADQDLQSDGCVLVVSVKTDGAEPTGFTFTADGKRAYMVIQHSPDDPATAGLDEGKFDDLLLIDGFDPAKAQVKR